MSSTAQNVAGHYIGGAWVGKRSERLSVNPAVPSERVLEHSGATEGELDAAIAAASSALVEWQALPGPARAVYLRRVAAALERDEQALTELVVREEGKPWREASGEVRRAALIFHFHAAQTWQAQGEVFSSSNAREEIRTLRTPVGVVAVITPWNFPIAIPAWKIAPALAHGNTVVWKPASATPAVAVALAGLLDEARLPPGVLNLILGDGAIGNALTRHPAVAAVTFTGSDRVGRAIWSEATPRGIRVQLEMGGQSAAVVLADADLANAAQHIVNGAMGASGQKCTATRRVVAVAAVYDELVERLRSRVRDLKVGNGLERDTDVGPLVSATARDEVLADVRRAVEEGGAIIAGGEALGAPSLTDGFYVSPTLVADVVPGNRLAQEEVFGPVLAVMKVADEDEALARANDTRYGLAAAVFTASERAVRRALRELDAGLIHVNNATTGGEPHVPFGGLRDSSSQAPREQGQTARDFFTKLKTAYIEAVD